MSVKLYNIVGFGINIMSEDNTKITNLELFGALFIGAYSYINSGFCRSNVEIGRYTSIGRQVTLGLGVHDINCFSTSSCFSAYYNSPQLSLASENPKRRVIIGNDVWIGDGVFIKSGVKIGDGAVIGANCVVTKDVPPYSVVAGVPGRIIRNRFSDDVINKMLSIKWWCYEHGDIIRWLESSNCHMSELIINASNFLKNKQSINYTSYKI